MGKIRTSEAEKMIFSFMQAAAEQSVENIRYYETLVIIMFAINSIIVAVLGFMLKKFFNDIKENQKETVEIHRNQILLEEKVRSNKEILDQKINLQFNTLSNNIETLGKNIQGQYSNIRQEIQSMKEENRDKGG